MQRKRKQRILEKLAARSKKVLELSEEAIKALMKTHPHQAKALQSIRKSKPAGDAARKLPKGSDAQADAIAEARRTMGINRATASGKKTPLRSPEVDARAHANKKRRTTPATNWGMTPQKGREAEALTWNTRKGGNVGTPGARGRGGYGGPGTITRWNRFVDNVAKA